MMYLPARTGRPAALEARVRQVLNVGDTGKRSSMRVTEAV
jgi:hypothetical protein